MPRSTHWPPCSRHCRRRSRPHARTRNQQGVLIEPGWRRDNPAASQLHGQHELKEREAHALQIAITQRQLRRSTLKNSVLPHHRGQVEEVESLLEQHRAALADVQARQARGERSPFAELRRRVMGGPGRWQRDRSSRLSFAPSPRARALSRRPQGLRQVRQEAAATQHHDAAGAHQRGQVGRRARVGRRPLRRALGHALGASPRGSQGTRTHRQSHRRRIRQQRSELHQILGSPGRSKRASRVAPSSKLHCRPGR